MAFLILTQLGSDRKIAIAVDAIGYIQETATGHALIYVGSGDAGVLTVSDTFESVMDWLKEAGEAY